MYKLPDRAVALDGATNFRDLGGYAGHGGRTLRWRRLFRSDHLAGLTAADQAVLAGLGLRRAIDFRGIDERAATPYGWPGLDQHSLSIEPTVVQNMHQLSAAGQALTVAVVAELMKDLYRDMVRLQARRFGELFDQLLQADAPLVFHCTAGKDRTGVAAALILSALGVPRTVVMQDYLLSNTLYRRPAVPDGTIPPDALAVLWRVQEGFLAAALDAIEADHGSVDAYLRGRLGLTPAALKLLAERYLEPG